MPCKANPSCQASHARQSCRYEHHDNASVLQIVGTWYQGHGDQPLRMCMCCHWTETRTGRMDARAFTAMAARPSVPPILAPASWDGSAGDQVQPTCVRPEELSACCQELPVCPSCPEMGGKGCSGVRPACMLDDGQRPGSTSTADCWTGLGMIRGSYRDARGLVQHVLLA